MEKNKDNLTSLTIHKMRVSKPVKQTFEKWRDQVQRPTAVIFEDLMRHAMATGYEPSERDVRKDPITN